MSGELLRPLVASLIGREASGRSWLPPLIAATPDGEERLGDLFPNPGSLLSTLAVATPEGSLGCFEHPVHPPRELLAWYIDHPASLVWPAGASLSAGTERLRRALIDDDPAGARHRAQERAHELLEVRSALSQEWWRFEEMFKPDCVLITDRLSLVVLDGARASEPATPWYPHRIELIRHLEAASQLGYDRAWGLIVVSDADVPLGDLAAGAPHLSDEDRAELARGYLGYATWDSVAALVPAGGR